MQSLIYSLIISFLSLFNPIDNSPEFHEVTAENGDGSFSILRRYMLLSHPCNISKFYQLNKLDNNSILTRGRTYKLPVLVYKFNGSSIRSTIGINNWDKAVRIDNYNKELVSKKIRKSPYQIDKSLWVPFHELECIEVTNSASFENKATKIEESKTKHFSIFGKKNSRVTIVDKSLSGRAFYIISGHGGPDPGAQSKIKKLCEDEYAYDVSLRLHKILLSHGAESYMIIQDPNDGIRDGKYFTGDSDEVCIGGKKIPINQKARLAQRTDATNRLFKKNRNKGIKDHRVIAIHVDSRGTNQRIDAFFYHSKGSKNGARMAQNIQNTFKSKYEIHQKGRGYKGSVSSRGLYVIENTIPPCVYVELANIRNTDDQKRIVLSSNRQALAKWLYEGLIK